MFNFLLGNFRIHTFSFNWHFIRIGGQRRLHTFCTYIGLLLCSITTNSHHTFPFYCGCYFNNSYLQTLSFGKFKPNTRIIIWPALTHYFIIDQKIYFTFNTGNYFQINNFHA